MKYVLTLFITSLAFITLNPMHTQAFLPVDAIDLNDNQWERYCAKWKFWNFDNKREDIKQEYIKILTYLADVLIMQTNFNDIIFSELSIKKVFTLPNPNFSCSQEKEDFLWRLNFAVCPIKAIYENNDINKAQRFSQAIVNLLKAKSN